MGNCGLDIERLRARLLSGLVIPAHPLALNASRRMDERRQRALTRYYRDAGAGGVAVAVHTTQFAIRDVGLFEPVLSLASSGGEYRGLSTRHAKCQPPPIGWQNLNWGVSVGQWISHQSRSREVRGGMPYQ